MDITLRNLLDVQLEMSQKELDIHIWSFWERSVRERHLGVMSQLLKLKFTLEITKIMSIDIKKENCKW